MTLRRPWVERLEALTQAPLPHAPLWLVNRAVEIGSWFVSEWAWEAEQEGWQPAHILLPPNFNARDRGGLAWRWVGPPVVHRVHKRRMAVRTPFAGLGGSCDETWFVYEAHRDGQVATLTGAARRKVLDEWGLSFGQQMTTAAGR